MEKIFDTSNLLNTVSLWGGAIGGAAAYILGGWDVLLKTIIFLAITDYITGWIKAIYKKELSSQIAFIGILRKIVMFIVIATAYQIQVLVGNNMPLREVVIMFYICNEGLSLLENAAVFIPIPDKLKEILLQLRDTNQEEKSE